MAKILGLDVGDSTIGVAVSDTLGWTAQGVTTIRRKTITRDLHSLRTLIRDHEVTEVVVGMPLKKNGDLDAQTRKILRFTRLLRSTFHLPVTTWDERFSTVAASKALERGNVTKKKKAALIDKVAAMIILQSYLDSRNEGGI
ncbi:Holliday junction resolvase RuvX [candidate division KSB3 bacterium]|uniref:Putative pre-16S rRNA nuclease n=1 Tax=candidate division KSB3 bacterium TaxID=2044937 RepID=A0A9D5JSW9_9BACT|nr:Holliday junction resolvase RuvX [candidate division KSB3 bacterium]MBD3323449.1 Holliday junction resolvase RuvX [candidate division KSB3 bacterium]